MSLRRLSLPLGSAVALVAAASPARADDAASRPDKAACVAAHERAQSLHSTQKLRAAREAFLVCSSEVCPEILREDCARSIADLDATTPSVVFSATAEGGDVVDARVLLDGELVAERLDGRALAIDPGAHTARFLRAGRPPMEVQFVARAGEKNRAVSAAFARPRASSSPARVEAEGRRAPVLPILLGSAGVVALGGGLAFRLSADAAAEDMRRSCAPSCDGSARDALGDKIVASNVSFAVGGFALAVAAVTWLVDSNR
jgi:hypothetical protein